MMQQLFLMATGLDIFVKIMKMSCHKAYPFCKRAWCQGYKSKVFMSWGSFHHLLWLPPEVSPIVQAFSKTIDFDCYLGMKSEIKVILCIWRSLIGRTFYGWEDGEVDKMTNSPPLITTGETQKAWYSDFKLNLNLRTKNCSFLATL